jgi:hypothetical protein
MGRLFGSDFCYTIRAKDVFCLLTDFYKDMKVVLCPVPSLLVSGFDTLAYATCPLPPKQNVLPIDVEAGEKNFGHHSQRGDSQ